MDHLRSIAKTAIPPIRKEETAMLKTTRIAFGIIGGIIAVAAAANANRPPQPYYPQPPAYAAAPAATGRKEIPLTNLEGGGYMLSASVNGMPVRFLLDTGADGVSISQPDADRLLRSGLLSPTDAVDRVNVHDANGGSRSRPVVMLRELNVGGYVLHNVEATISSGDTSLLGQRFLRDFESYTIDNSRNVLVLG
jgi:aspartyl protease family protein